MAKTATFETISFKPLTGLMDLRSRPADLPVGSFRWRQSWSCSSENKLCRRQGFSRLFPDHLFSGVYHNDDLHHQGATRETITFLYESTDNGGLRRLFSGTQSRVSLLDESTGYWTDVITGKGDSGSRWKAASLQDYIVLTNNFDKVLSYQLSNGNVSEISELSNLLHVTKAAVVVQFNGVMFVMNVVQDAALPSTDDPATLSGRISSRVRWSDLNRPLNWNPAATDSIAGFQDLDYGDDILAAVEMFGSLIIYTTRSIWRCSVSGGATGPAFAFSKIYSEPKNQSGCLAFPNTLVSTGNDHYYMSKDGIYHFNPYLAAPEREDWIHRADGAIYVNPISKLDATFCASPVAEYLPVAKELWFSWGATGYSSVPNWTLVLNIDQKSADIVDTGFTAFANYRPGQSSSEACNAAQLFIGASGRDWALKQIGGVFYREFITLVDDLITNDIPLDAGATFFTEGYYSILRGMIPLGLIDRDKVLRKFIIDDDVSEQDVPCVWRLRIGRSLKLVDPNDLDDRCSPLWVRMDDKPIECPDGQTVSSMLAQNLVPGESTEWTLYERGRFLYFELVVSNKGGEKAIGGDVCLSRIDFDVMPMPKPY